MNVTTNNKSLSRERTCFKNTVLRIKNIVWDSVYPISHGWWNDNLRAPRPGWYDVNLVLFRKLLIISL